MQIFQRAVELSPDIGHGKYMSLGQIHTGQEAVDYYMKGIQVLLSSLEKQAEKTVGSHTLFCVHFLFCSSIQMWTVPLFVFTFDATYHKRALLRHLWYNPRRPVCFYHIKLKVIRLTMFTCFHFYNVSDCWSLLTYILLPPKCMTMFPKGRNSGLL